MTNYPLQGGCFCGAVRYEITTPPMFVNCCHCSDCQKQVGSAFAINAIIEADRVNLLSGALECIEMKTDSGSPHDIYRCPACKSALWSDYGRRRVALFLRVATLDTPSALPPDVHIYTRSKLDWVVLPEGVRAFAEYYDMEKEWPRESLARGAAVMAKRA
ncbi:hypothetical protein FHS83_002609 [Rhizomicrobium palustre]|uniref:CENP-V/GFA domain-containing protein n=1 Tax=Rhizomicrobium palustre TaxID=189966 RepID=A0A846N1V7_9PROT|nr:GFA family protein [Rhizomicrobium palustre]NIK89291.1 hypothetical protein [Rhizomicrobium palustre]